MFGYIRPLKPELKIKEFESYKSVYCGLCKAIGKNHGLIARTTLTYDMTFLAMLRMGISDKDINAENFRCALNPLKKRCRCAGHKELDYAADAGCLLFYYTVKDKISDPGFLNKLKGVFLLPFAAHFRKKALKRTGSLDSLIKTGLDRLSRIEKSNKASIDEPAAAFGDVLSEIMSFGVEDSKNALILKRAGFYLGRWIYIIDAFDDLEKDIKQGAYNPIKLMWGADDLSAYEIKEKAKNEILYTLTLSLHETLLATELLDIKKYREIIMNILELGLVSGQNGILNIKEINK